MDLSLVRGLQHEQKSTFAGLLPEPSALLYGEQGDQALEAELSNAKQSLSVNSGFVRIRYKLPELNTSLSRCADHPPFVFFT